jgi:hypothetical protein
VLAGVVCLYHLFVVHQAVRVIHAGIDYVTFMTVVGSSFVVAGGIHLRVKSPSGAMRNTLFLFFGALLGNLIAFFATALGLHGFDINEPPQVASFILKNGGVLTALSLGATFFGALTYVGNSPNLIVKTIAEHARVPTPSFVGYIWKFAIPILIPVFGLISILFSPDDAGFAWLALMFF